ncbi:hypothetical protein EYV94_19730 [Puteibacter caeruleilacunae]|nr:hypothetical protein EYV94_19730 [Puteibacter caeruleilacunae]
MILVYTKDINSRVRYAFQFIFNSILGAEVELTSDFPYFEQSKQVRINYSSEISEKGLQLIPSGLLQKNQYIRKPEVGKRWHNLPTLFPQKDPQSFIPFDIFSSTFFLITRMEEYECDQLDKHGRFAAESSIAYKHDFLKQPLVDQWSYQLAKTIQSHYPQFIVRNDNRSFTLFPTFDIDNAFAYKHKELKRQLLGCAKELFSFQFRSLMQRLSTTFSSDTDPFDNYEYIFNTINKHNTQSLYFFLLGDLSRYDRNISHHCNAYQSIIQRCAQQGTVGIHPSYNSNENSATLKTEIDRLHRIINKPVEKSRQHYLKLSFPDTYRSLIKEGIQEDFTMGYSSQVGFRASTCTPFSFYDLHSEQSTSLTVYSFAFMDSTLNQYLGLTTEQATEEIKSLLQHVHNVDGIFISLWHNQNLCDQGIWRGWREVYETMFTLKTSVTDERGK